MKERKLLTINILTKIFLLFFLVFPLTFTAQNMTIFGNVIDTLNNSSKKDAFPQRFSTMVDAQMSIDLHNRSYFITIQYFSLRNIWPINNIVDVTNYVLHNFGL